MFTLLSSLTFIAISIACVLSIVYRTLRNGISPMPSSRVATGEILQLAASTSPKKIYELGAGIGTLLLPLAQTNPIVTAIGYESSPIPFAISWTRIKIKGLPNAQIARQDFFEADLSDADLIVCYLYPKAMEKLRPKFERELKPGTYVISNTFSIPGWTPLKTIKTNDFYHTKIYLYKS